MVPHTAFSVFNKTSELVCLLQGPIPEKLSLKDLTAHLFINKIQMACSYHLTISQINSNVRWNINSIEAHDQT